jgi:hypothetical protein
LHAHEYSIVGHSRSVVGRWLYISAAALASAFTAAGVAISNFAALFSVPLGTQTFVLAPVSAAMVFSLVHFAFSKWGWKVLCRFAQVPDISGQWLCEGTTVDDDGRITYEWNANVTISQDWEKIRVRLKTKQSGSFSVSASLLPEGDGRWMLMYSYRNEPRQGEPELKSHIGYCELVFSADGRSAEGDYFNARGRKTAGRMNLTKEV